ncbi:MAG: antibiotic biosynthesis monooxygenase [Gemmatimonadetes bacterium]|nr:antibiotic biosynthesis monooxygenase [Gemmatimonadota bacterium]
MYGLIGSFIATPGSRDALRDILLASTGDMPGCRSYVVYEDTNDENTLWISEVWEREEDHRASLQLPEVRAAIAQAKPLIAGFGAHHVVRPVGGVGLS